MKKLTIVIFIYILNSVCGNAQNNLLIRGVLVGRIGNDNEFIKFSISVQNNSKDTIYIPDTSVHAISKSSAYLRSFVVFNAKREGQKGWLDCDYLISGLFDDRFQILMPGETRHISAYCLDRCFRRSGRYSITFYFKTHTIESKGKWLEKEVESELLKFSM